ncbi:MAG: hypothetical protein KAS32_13800 [Candidatus Peribacteraceae bacterium]|nr:hypothetical protein [Candidatus Peribacteraceae bacterium]
MGQMKKHPPEVQLNTIERTTESGKLLHIIQRESGSVAASAIVQSVTQCANKIICAVCGKETNVVYAGDICPECWGD